MSSVNKVFIIGNLGQDPETRFTQSGACVCNLSVATSEQWKDKQTGERKEQTEWHRVNVWGKLAEICGKYLKKGSKVYIEGSIHTRKWQDQQGNDRYSTEIKAKEMRMLDGKPSGQERQPQQGPRAGQAKPDDYEFEDDIPF